MNRMPVPVVFVTDAFIGMAGAERNIFQLATLLDKASYRPFVYCLEGGPLAEELRKEGIPVTSVQVQKIYSPKAVWEGLKFVRFLRKRKVGIVVTYHEGADFWAGMFARLAGVPVIISSRRDMGYKLSRRHHRMYRFFNRLYDAIVVVSRAVGQRVVELQGTDPRKVVTLYNGVEPEQYRRSFDIEAIKRSAGITRMLSPVVGIVGGLRRVKGHACFVEAAARVAKEKPEAVFLIVGALNHERDCAEEVRDMVARLGLADRVIFAGERSDIAEVVSVMDICVISSSSEGMSNAVLEYMASGKPVIATDVGGNPELVADGVTGILVPPRDAEALATAMRTLLDDASLRRRMGEAGRKRILDEFSMDAMLGATDRLYRRLLEGKTRVAAGPGDAENAGQP